MIHENELVMLLLCLGVVVFTLFNNQKLKRFYNWKLLFSAFILFPAACLFTILEEFMLKEIFNYLEHICYAGSSVMLAIWCYTSIVKEKAEND